MEALELPCKIGLRTHIIDSSNYSIKELIDLHSGILLDELRAAYDTMHTHITQQCELCKARDNYAPMMRSFIHGTRLFIDRINEFVGPNVIIVAHGVHVCKNDAHYKDKRRRMVKTVIRMILRRTPK